MTYYNTPGILLQSTPFLDRKVILKIFTQSLGIVSTISRGRSTFAPFCIAEWVLRKGSKELYLLQDATLLHPLLELRQHPERLFGAGTIARSLLQSKLDEEPDAKLYQLAVWYLQKLLSAAHPATFASSFQLKVLLHEGFLSLPQRVLTFSSEEWETVSLLAGAHLFSMLNQLAISVDLQIKIQQLFTERIQG